MTKTNKKLYISLVTFFIILIISIFLDTNYVQAVSKVQLNTTSKVLIKGTSYTLKVKNTKKKAKWYSSNKKIATVNSNGRVKAIKSGTTTIKAKVGTKSYSCKITVRNKEIFEDYYTKADKKMKKMKLDEKIAQLLLVRFPEKDGKEILKKYQFGGYIFFTKDFKGKTKSQIINRNKELQKVAKIPILTAVDEEGGSVVRISSNKKLIESKFESPMTLYKLGGFNKIKQDTIKKSNFLSSLGINLNLAPVVDVSTNSKDYMYKRTLGKGTKLTSTYAKTVISSSKGRKVSYTLKHFPGYGNNVDTHTGKAIDKRKYKDILNNDLPPFRAGINAGAEAVLISHNIVTSIDKNNPASLSAKVHKLLRNNLNFTGIIITDAIDMGAVSNDKNATVKAIQAGNDLIITTDYKASITSVKKALKSGKISQKTIDKAVRRVLAWKYYKKMI